MGLLGWIILGLIVGALTNWLAPERFPGDRLGTVLGGVAGAFLGGALFSLIADRGITGFDLTSLVIAFVGAALLVTVLRMAGRADGDERELSHPRTRA